MIEQSMVCVEFPEQVTSPRTKASPVQFLRLIFTPLSHDAEQNVQFDH